MAGEALETIAPGNEPSSLPLKWGLILPEEDLEDIPVHVCKESPRTPSGHMFSETDYCFERHMGKLGSVCKN